MTIIEEERKMREFKAGSIFGELAIESNDKKPRMLSTMAKTDCICLILDKDTYDILIKVKKFVVLNGSIGKSKEGKGNISIVFVRSYS
jgi:CRP-like cAMP-binding protein